MKVVFALRSWANVHYYHSLATTLLDRGHSVHLLFDKQWSAKDPRDALDTLLAEYPGVSWEYLRLCGTSRFLVNAARELRSYRRYLVIPGQSDYYRRRWRRYLPLWLNVLVRTPGADALLRRECLGRFFAWFENRIPAAKSVEAHLKELQPDVVVAAPANLRFDTELEYLKAARALGIPTVLPVYSWDNLTTKGLIHTKPDRLLVWNGVQKAEAISHHNIPETSIQIVGALFFDKWLTQRIATPREKFCKMHGLDPAKPFVLYLGSSRNIAPNEIWLIEELSRVLNIQILARPHPANMRPYEKLPAEVRLMQPGRGVPATRWALQALYDALTHAAVVVGINTSAMLDAICLDRPVVSVLTERYKETQEEAAHFGALRGSGAIEVVTDTAASATRVAAILAGEDITAHARKRFLAEWIWPRGIGRAAGEWAADEVEKLAAESTKRHN